MTPRADRTDRAERGRAVLHQDDKATITARRAIVAIGRSGNFRKLGVPGEDLDKVYNRLFDPKEFAGQNALVVGGGDSALETAIALATCGAHVTLSYRRKEFSRAKPENIEKIEMLVRDATADVQVEKPTSERVNTAVTSGMRGQKSPGSLTLALGTEVTRIEPDRVFSEERRSEARLLPNDVRLHHARTRSAARILSALRNSDRGRGDAPRLDRARAFPRLLHLSFTPGNRAASPRPG